ncbi:MAG TPA: GspH/FimT family pseudopilin [Candidatus Acidoferrales bacterium]|nr:GspH/FimT family pseudopilin [Candidatus Acidoferrales bacterium]
MSGLKLLKTKLSNGSANEANTGSRQARRNGFTLVELLTVVAIIFTVAAIGVPKLITAIRVDRVRSGAAAILSVVQQARSYAVQKNTTVNVYRGAVAGGNSGAFADTTGSGSSFSNGDIYSSYPANVTTGTSSSAPSGLTSSLIGFTASSSTSLSFNSLGTASAGVVYYVTDAYGDWAAVSVSPLGRSKVWVWNGAQWQ